jgi:P27 family predicted phage terminase small subunit
MGRTPKPIELCNPRHAKYGKPGETPRVRLTDGMPFSEPPSDVTKVFDILVGHLSALGILGDIDQIQLQVYAQMIVDYYTAKAQVEADGWTLDTDVYNRNGEVISTKRSENPAVKRMYAIADRIYSFGAKFGLTPADRRGIAAPKPADDPGRKFKGML